MSTLKLLNQIDEAYVVKAAVKTAAKAVLAARPPAVDIYSEFYPPLPDFKPIVNNTIRQSIFGKFPYTVNPNGSIKITNDWAKINIVTIDIPQLVGLPTYGNKPFNGKVVCHKKAADPMKCLFVSWEAAGLLDRVIFWGGCYVPRMIRGSMTALSNHAFGSAFDINTVDNAMGKKPPLSGERGSVRELVPMANNQGWFWGGHFSRKDGMHFELTKV